jgi:predicted branched-subunit amino acid permease
LAEADPRQDPAHDGAGPVPLRNSPAARIGLSIAVATGLYGISFGALGVASGLDVPQTVALSLLMFTGGSQFAFIGVIAGGGSGAAATAAATLLGVRNAVYGMQLNAMFAPAGWRRFVAPQFTIDESTATAVGQEAPTEQRRGFWVAGVGVFVLWNVFTAIGALAGNALGDPKQWGLDGAAVAAFLGLLWPRLRGREPWAIAVVCALATVLAVPFVPPGVPILIAALVAAVLGWLSHARAAAGRPAAGAGVEGLGPDLDPYSRRDPHGDDGDEGRNADDGRNGGRA